MRIGLVTACYEPVRNGVTHMVSLYKKYLERSGHEVLIFTLGSKKEIISNSGVIKSPGVPLGRSGYFYSPRYASQAQHLLSRMDIIHCHHPLMGLELAGRYGRCPIIFTNHTRYDLYLAAYSPLPLEVASKLSRHFWPMMLKKSDCIIAPSDSIRDILKKQGVTGPIEVIGNGVELGLFKRKRDRMSKVELNIDDEAIIAIYVGRLAPEKSADKLLLAFAQAHRTNPRLHLLIVGGGSQTDWLTALANRLGIEPFIRFTGELPFEKVPAFLKSADFFVTASTSEVHPLTVMEALASGLPVVGRKSPGLSDLLSHMVNAYLADDVEDLARGMIFMAENRNRRFEMAKEALASSHAFDIQMTINKSLDLYIQLLSKWPTGWDKSTRHNRFIPSPTSHKQCQSSWS